MAKNSNSDKKESKHARYERKQRERGLVKVHPWCPANEAEAVKNYAAKKCKAHFKKTGK